MKPFARIATSITASFNALLDQIENHEAVVGQAMQEVATASAQATSRLNRVKQDGEKLERRLAELKDEEQQWTERAIRVGQEDEARGLECIRRLQRVRQDIAETETVLRKHREVRARLVEDIGTISGRLDELRRRKHELATRQYRAEALQALQATETGLMTELGDIFERWETKVAETEIFGACGQGLPDDFEQRFTGQEEQEALRQTLRELLERQAKDPS